MNIEETIRKEIERQRQFIEGLFTEGDNSFYDGQDDAYLHILHLLDTLPEQPVSDHHEIEVEFRGEKVTISREFYRNGERNYSTSEQDDNAIWAALRAWCEKKEITPFELYPKQTERPMEETPEPYTGVYDEAYLQEKITKATKSWEGVDVDKMLAECRGYEQPVEGLEEEIDRLWESFSEEMSGPHNLFDMYRRLARHFAEWQKKLDDLETADLLAVAHLQGMEQQKAKMLEDAVEGEIQMRYSGCLCAKTIRAINEDKFKLGDKVKIIIVKED